MGPTRGVRARDKGLRAWDRRHGIKGPRGKGPRDMEPMDMGPRDMGPREMGHETNKATHNCSN